MRNTSGEPEESQVPDVRFVSSRGRKNLLIALKRRRKIFFFSRVNLDESLLIKMIPNGLILRGGVSNERNLFWNLEFLGWLGIKKNTF